MNEKTNAIRLWVSSVINTMERYEAERNKLLKEEHMRQLELAIWKAKLDEKEDEPCSCNPRQQLDVESMRRGKHITSGASIVIKNVFPFLEMR